MGSQVAHGRAGRRRREPAVVVMLGWLPCRSRGCRLGPLEQAEFCNMVNQSQPATQRSMAIAMQGCLYLVLAICTTAGTLKYG